MHASRHDGAIGIDSRLGSRIAREVELLAERHTQSCRTPAVSHLRLLGGIGGAIGTQGLGFAHGGGAHAQHVPRVQAKVALGQRRAGVGVGLGGNALPHFHRVGTRGSGGHQRVGLLGLRRNRVDGNTRPVALTGAVLRIKVDEVLQLNGVVAHLPRSLLGRGLGGVGLGQLAVDVGREEVNSGNGGVLVQPAGMLNLVVDRAVLVHIVGVVYHAVVVGINEEVGHAIAVDVDIEGDVAFAIALVQSDGLAVRSRTQPLRHFALNRGGVAVPLETGQHQLLAYEAALQGAAVLVGGDDHRAGSVIVDLKIEVQATRREE